MPAPDSNIPGAPVWVEISSSDLDRAGRFYGELFGWQPDDDAPELGDYVNFAKDGKRVAGGVRNDGTHGMSNSWSVYLATNDLRATVAAAEAAGARTTVPADEVGDLGAFAVLSDPGGARVGLWQSGRHTGFEVVGEPGAPTWFELHTPEYDRSLEFYRDALGWELFTVSDGQDFRYTTHSGPDKQYAGIMDASGFDPAGTPGHWFVYFGVDDTDGALEQVVELGGSVVEPAEDTPYGRLAKVTDPTGAEFKVSGPSVVSPAE